MCACAAIVCIVCRTLFVHCVCVRIRVCICVYMFECVYVCVCVSLCVCVCEYMSVYYCLSYGDREYASHLVCWQHANSGWLPVVVLGNCCLGKGRGGE